MTKVNAPNTYEQWIDLNKVIIPCMKVIPEIEKWNDLNLKISKEEWKQKFNHCEIALRLDDDVDFDIDNPLVKRFMNFYVKSCGAISGRPTNPKSHYWWKAKLKPAKFVLPKEFEEIYKKFPHGATLCEIRSGSNHFTIVPKSLHSKANEYVEWEKYEGIKEYPGDLNLDLRKIALSTALCILYAPKGERDAYCTAIAGILIKYTDWNENDINDFILNLASNSDDEEYDKRANKGSTVKKSSKKFGIPKLAEILKCTEQSVLSLFSWINVKFETVQGASAIGEIIEYGQDRYKVEVFTIKEDVAVKIHIIVDGPTLTKQHMFYDEVIKQASVWIPKMKPVDFEKIMRRKYEERTKSEDYVEEADENLKFIKYFKNYITKVKAYGDKKELYLHKLPYFNQEENSLYFNLDSFEDYLESQKIKIARVDLVMKIQDVLKSKKNKGKYENKSLVCWQIKDFDLNPQDVLLEGEIIDETRQIDYEN